MKLRFAPVAGAVLLSVGSAHAGQIANGVWTPTGCGAEPTPVTIDQANEEAFSKSLNASDAYSDKSKQYLDCMFKEAGADAQIINNSEKAAQDKRNTAVQKNEADTKSGLEKYGKHKK